MKQTRLVSGRVVVKNPGEVAQDRYQFLDLSSSEPNLGTASNGSILTTNTSGERIFTTNVAIDNATLSGNLIANAVYTENLFYANGEPYVTGGAGPTVSSNIFNGRVTVTNAQTLIDSFDLTGITSVRWVLSATDTVNDAYKTSTVDSSNDTVNIYYNEFGIVLSNPNIEVANYYAEIDGSTIKLYGTGTSISVPVTFQRTTLGSSTTLGNIQAVSYIAGTVGSGTATVVNVDNFVGTGSDTAFTLSVTPGAKNQTLIAIGGIVQPKSTYTLAGNVITFSSAPPTGAPIEIQTFVTTTVTGYTGSRGTDGVVGYTGSAGALTNWSKKTTNYTAVSGDRIIADTTGGTFTINLPATPLLGSAIKVTDGGNFSLTPLTIGANGSTIESQSNDVLVNIGKVDLEFIYDGSTWQIISTIGPRGYTGSASGGAGVGFTGSAGAQGASGFTGSAGAQGASGFTGSVGTFTGTTTEVIKTSNTTVSTSTSTGALVVAGGAGIAGELYVGGTTYVSGSIIPTSNNTINIGSPTARFGTIYVSANTIDIGGATISTTPSGDLEFETASGTIPITANTVNFLNTVSTTSIAQGDFSALAPVSPLINQVFVTNSSYQNLDDTAVDVAGGYIKITGSGFVENSTILIGNTPAISTTFISSTEIRAQIPTMSAGTYVIFLVNGNGQLAIKLAGITYSGFPTWVTGSTLTSRTSGTAFSQQLSATGATQYSLAAGSVLPTGLTLSSSGLLSGNITVASNTNFTFTVNADDAENQTSPRTFSLLVNVEVLLQYLVTWSNNGVGEMAWDYGRTPGGLIFNTIDRNGVSMNTARWPTAPGSVRITFIGTSTNINGTYNFSSVILPGQSGGFAGVTNNAYQVLRSSVSGGWTNVSDPFMAALNGETVIATVYLLPN
jgi:hypothetical protein